jgi:hypothetical protein
MLRVSELLERQGAPFNFKNREDLLNDVRLKLLNRELVLAEILAEQGENEFAVVPPVFTHEVDGGGSDQEDKVERHRTVEGRREKEESIAEASASASEGAARSSATTIPVDLNNSDDESGEDEREDPVPPAITREVLSDTWRKAGEDFKARFVLLVDGIEKDGKKVLEYCMGLEPAVGNGSSSGSDGGAEAAVPSGTAPRKKK